MPPHKQLSSIKLYKLVLGISLIVAAGVYSYPLIEVLQSPFVDLAMKGSVALASGSFSAFIITHG